MRCFDTRFWLRWGELQNYFPKIAFALALALGVRSWSIIPSRNRIFKAFRWNIGFSDIPKIIVFLTVFGKILDF
jgi:hypothetical protein